MTTSTAPRQETASYRCNICGLPLPLRLPLPGEVASSWVCQYCNNHFFATLIDDCDPEIISNVRPASDLNPRVVIGNEVLAKLYKRQDRSGRDFNERVHDRRTIDFGMTILAERGAIAASAIDLSAGGIGFRSPWELAIDDRVTVRFDYLPGAPTSRCIVRFCHRESPDCYRIGAEFILPDRSCHAGDAETAPAATPAPPAG